MVNPISNHQESVAMFNRQVREKQKLERILKDIMTLEAERKQEVRASFLVFGTGGLMVFTMENDGQWVIYSELCWAD